MHRWLIGLHFHDWKHAFVLPNNRCVQLCQRCGGTRLCRGRAW